MAHQHGHARLFRRQRGRQEEDEDEAGVTVIEIITVPNTRPTRVIAVTTSAPKTLVPPAIATRPMITASEDDKNDDESTTTTRPTTTAATSRRPASTTRTTESEAEETTTVKSINDQSTLMVATKSPTPLNSGSLAGALVSATASVSATISATPTSGASDGESAGMSGGAKAGLALGILVGVAALLAGILFVYRRKKNAIAAEKDNEKIGMHDAPAPLPPQVPTGAAAAAPSIRTNRTMSTAPRLSLRPVTQFDPTFNEQRKSGGNLLSVAAAAAPVAMAHDRAAPSDERPVSAWERRGAANAGTDSPTANPFNDPQTPANSQPPANPFGNSAALDTAHAAIPDSPPQVSPQHSAAPSTDLNARLVPAPTAAPEVDATAAAMAMSSVPMPEHEFPAPPSANVNNSVPPSPAWTEDVPSSPAMGTPMIAGAAGAAGAMAAGRPNGPPSGPNNVHRVQLDFKPSMADELELKAGTLVRMLHEYDDGWALCISMDRTHQGVVPRTCLSKHPVKPRTGPPRQGPPPPHMRGPPIRSPMGPGGIPQPRPMSPADGRSSPHPPALSPASGRMSPGPRQMHSPQMHSPQMQGPPRHRAHSNAPYPGSPQGRGRSNSNAPYAGPPRSMSPGPYGGGPMAPPPQMGRPRSNSAGQVNGARRGPAPGPSPMNPNAGPVPAPLASAVPNRKPVPGMAL